jgi:hypothetical protein
LGPAKEIVYVLTKSFWFGLGLTVSVEYRDETTQVSQNYEIDEVQE